jgi:NAD(P)-dependent dehydrogenase (short-subunit alcohol dehydrogenase family)
MNFGLKDKVAIVTGASGNIGEAIARDFVQEGVKLSLIYHTKKCDELATKLEKAGSEVMIYKADVSKAKDVTTLVDATYEKFGRIDILVNNAGIAIKGSVEETTEEEWDKIMTVNLKSVFLLSKETLKHMKKQRWGRIINIGSLVAKTGTNARPWIDPCNSSQTSGGAYAASKAGVHIFTNTLAKESAAYRIAVNCIAPGPIKTSMTPVLPKPLNDQMPISRIGESNEISALVVFLASKRAAFITGETIDINGGIWMD